jgi:exopolysaccharide biosynthesis WecB/TagA/CpsF family protein
MNNKISLLGLYFDDLCIEEVIDLLLRRDPEEAFAYVVTPNADHFARLRKSPKLSKILGILRLPRPSVVTGADLAMQLLGRMDGENVAIIGLREPDFVILQLRYPNILFTHHLPPMNLLQDATAFEQARDFGVTQCARFIFIALGSPLQELLADAIASQTGSTGIALCIGAALEFCVGRSRRAPLWMQYAGLEWLHRLVHNPVRLGRRYLLKDPPVLLALLAAAWRRA